jgi:hypothetical protein
MVSLLSCAFLLCIILFSVAPIPAYQQGGHVLSKSGADLYKHTYYTRSRSCALQMKSCSSYDDLLNRLRRVAVARDVEKGCAIEAINILEKEIALPAVEPNAVRGEWELVFSSLIGPGYFPITELCDFYKFSLVSSFGPIPLGSFIGESKVTSERPLVRIDARIHSTFVVIIDFHLNV